MVTQTKKALSANHRRGPIFAGRDKAELKASRFCVIHQANGFRHLGSRAITVSCPLLHFIGRKRSLWNFSREKLFSFAIASSFTRVIQVRGKSKVSFSLEPATNAVNSALLLNQSDAPE